ncbi:VOC family protein [Aestuariimicrobium ganziense]|uniref:VOC family protein n=1 Tax=Aestuariimicrobium ganziense TaxID=2773677 RepID=UPI0019448E59|nr:VOC family protein [Aestuariimicrobium ganziense]
MHVDHLIFAARPEGLKATVDALSEQLGQRFRDGGFHPRFGTRNHILPLADARYLEVVEVLDHPAAEKAVFGQAVRARQNAGGGWLGWVISVDDLTPYESRLERKAVPGSRHFPDGRLLEWEQIGIRGTMADPQLPYFMRWTSPAELLPSALGGDIKVSQIDISGSRPRIEEWLGAEVGDDVDGVTVHFSAPNGQPGLDAVTFEVPGRGAVRI